jgi:hypothetical protein
MVLCHPSWLTQIELSRKGIVRLDLNKPAELHATLKDVLGD